VQAVTPTADKTQNAMSAALAMVLSLHS